MTKNKNNFQANLHDFQKPVNKFLKENEISIITGAPGTGKDFMCMYTALEYLSDRQFGYENLIITKPVVEIGRSIGLLPGDLKEKIDPYRKSFDDVVDSILGKSNSGNVKKIKDKIKFEPINFVRGNTFKNSIVILSEAQNCTLHELISFMTRLDKSSKMFINGDLMQSDIGSKTGLKDLLRIIEKVDGIESKSLGDKFQTRNPMIVKLNKEYVNYKSDL